MIVLSRFIETIKQSREVEGRRQAAKATADARRAALAELDRIAGERAATVPQLARAEAEAKADFAAAQAALELARQHYEEAHRRTAAERQRLDQREQDQQRILQQLAPEPIETYRKDLRDLQHRLQQAPVQDLEPVWMGQQTEERQAEDEQPTAEERTRATRLDEIEEQLAALDRLVYEEVTEEALMSRVAELRRGLGAIA
jgi:hypothetical protein